MEADTDVTYGHRNVMVWTQHTCNGRYGKEMEAPILHPAQLTFYTDA